jgi:hypothetical protein
MAWGFSSLVSAARAGSESAPAAAGTGRIVGNASGAGNALFVLYVSRINNSVM